MSSWLRRCVGVGLGVAAVMLGLVALATQAGLAAAGRTTLTFDYGWLFHLGDPPGSGVRVFIRLLRCSPAPRRAAALLCVLFLVLSLIHI